MAQRARFVCEHGQLRGRVTVRRLTLCVLLLGFTILLIFVKFSKGNERTLKMTQFKVVIPHLSNHYCTSVFIDFILNLKRVLQKLKASLND